jgi:hypothetical protein
MASERIPGQIFRVARPYYRLFRGGWNARPDWIGIRTGDLKIAMFKEQENPYGKTGYCKDFLFFHFFV